MSGLRAREIAEFLAGPGRSALAEYLSRQRWFAAKARTIGEVWVDDWAELRPAPAIALLLLRTDGERYYAPVAAAHAPPPDARRAVAACGAEVIVDAHWDPDFGPSLLSAISAEAVLRGGVGRFACRAVQPWRGPSAREAAVLAARPIEGEQSNTSLLFGRDLVLKSFRRPRAGVNPDLEITRFLTGRVRSADVPPLVGWIDYAGSDGEETTLAVLQAFVDNRGDGWDYALAGLRHLGEAAEREGASTGGGALADELAEPMRSLGAVTGRLHSALASDAGLPEFRPEPITGADTAEWAEDIARGIDKARSELAALPTAAPLLAAIDRGAALGESVRRALDPLADGQTCKIRCHGDYHLGQVLKTPDAFAVIDFEGEPTRPLAERRRKQVALRDVAGMLRSFDYAIHAVARERAAKGRAPLLDRLAPWRDAARRVFLSGYADTVSRSPVRLVPDGRDAFIRACGAFELEKACYELSYEIDYRPDWIAIPLAGIARILDERSAGA